MMLIQIGLSKWAVLFNFATWGDVNISISSHWPRNQTAVDRNKFSGDPRPAAVRDKQYWQRAVNVGIPSESGGLLPHLSIFAAGI
jgi:hypothetical protein